MIDDFSRECLALEVDTSLGGRRVAGVLDRLVERRGAPIRIVMVNGPEFTGQALDEWAYRHGVELAFIRPGKPIENCLVEGFKEKFRDECLNEHWLVSLADARQTIETWRLDYNQVRPHSSLGGVSPEEFAEKAALRSLHVTTASPDQSENPSELAE